MTDEFGMGSALLGESAASITWAGAKAGQSLVLEVAGSIKMTEQRDYDDQSKIKTWDDGNPKKAAVIPVVVLEGSDTWIKDPDDPSKGNAHEVGTQYNYYVPNNGKMYPAWAALITLEKQLMADRKFGLSAGDVVKVTFVKAERAPGQTRGKPSKHYKWEFLRREAAEQTSVFDE